MLELLQCPFTKEKLLLKGKNITNFSCTRKYKINKNSIILFESAFCNKESKIQSIHYNRIYKAYIKNLDYPHTREYFKYLNKPVIKLSKKTKYGTMAEICCGRGEAISLLNGFYKIAIGIDISEKMLNKGSTFNKNKNCFFIQGDALKLPLKSKKFDSVYMLGGIHHINNRRNLFCEIKRILKPGGVLIFREPVSDFFFWRFLRWIIYHFSPSLDSQTERPLRFKETMNDLNQVGLKLVSWETYGFFGFCFFMNSDVLIFNRLFQFIPGIRWITKSFVFFDRAILKIPGFQKWGLQVVAKVKN